MTIYVPENSNKRPGLGKLKCPNWHNSVRLCFIALLMRPWCY